MINYIKILIKFKINRIDNYLQRFRILTFQFIRTLLKSEKLIALDVGAQGGFNSDNFDRKYNIFFEHIFPIKSEAKKLNDNKFVIDNAFGATKAAFR